MHRGPRLIGSRRVATLGAVAIVFVAGAVSAPATVASGAGRATAGRCAKGVRGQVTTAYATVFSRNDPATAPDRSARLQGGTDPVWQQLLASWLDDPAGRGTTVTVNAVRCIGSRRARVEADLVLSGTSLPGVLPPGTAVRDGDTWKVSRATFCARMTLENPALASSGPCAAR